MLTSRESSAVNIFDVQNPVNVSKNDVLKDENFPARMINQTQLLEDSNIIKQFTIVNK